MTREEWKWAAQYFFKTLGWIVGVLIGLGIIFGGIGYGLRNHPFWIAPVCSGLFLLAVMIHGSIQLAKSKSESKKWAKEREKWKEELKIK